MSLWRLNDNGEPETFLPSEYVFHDMDSELAFQVLGKLLDELWVGGILSSEAVIDILGLPGLYGSKHDARLHAPPKPNNL